MNITGNNSIRWGLVILLSLLLSLSCDKGDEAKENFDDQFETFTDERDGHVYKLITIGTQTWMAENLAYLPTVNTLDDFSATEERYHVYGYSGTSVDEAISLPNFKLYGVLYNWEAAQNGCPAGWHLPEKEEWNSLSQFLLTNNNGKKILADSLAFSLMAPFGWPNFFDKDSLDTENSGRNRTLFSALPGGYLYHDGEFHSSGSSAFWWTASDQDEINAEVMILTFDSPGFQQYRYNKEACFSVRCVKDK
jgi:uncharacterized protein (TIGR02145 family)